jgi:hypothetical protein
MIPTAIEIKADEMARKLMEIHELEPDAIPYLLDILRDISHQADEQGILINPLIRQTIELLEIMMRKYE